MRQNKLLVILLAISLGLFVMVVKSQAQYSTSGTVNSPDAIAVRIVPNPNHYSISRWYASQGFQGSPQALTVDGYEAIRDGRTVYVSAANVDASKNIFTNIYLISYNQNPAPNTIDILGQIISHWKFNDNLQPSTNIATSSCSISTLDCNSNTDCAAGQFCATSGSASSTCQFQTTKNCQADADCPTNFFCDSLKSQITRDVKRVGQLSDLREALANFKAANNHYPTLSAGTYLPNNSVSLWPSWSAVLLTDLAVSPGLIDPVNHLGACPGYDPATCWNQNTKSFFSIPSAATLVLPNGSQAFAYSVSSNGSNYNLCATIESRAPGLDYHFSPNDPSSSNCVTAIGVSTGASATNTAPQLVDKYLSGETNQEFNGFVSVADADNDPLTWSLDTYSTSGWSGWHNGGKNNQPPILLDTSNPGQKKVYAQLAGAPGTYNTTLTVSDGRGGILTIPTPITIFSSAVIITADDAQFSPDTTTPVNYSFTFSGNNLVNAAASYAVTKLSGPFDLLADLKQTFLIPGNNNYQVSYQGLIPSSVHFSQDTAFQYNIAVTDKLGHVTNKTFTITIITTRPTLNLNCPDTARLNQAYSCLLGPATQDGHTLTYSATGLPAQLQVSGQSIVGTTTSAILGQPVTVTVANEYGTSVSSTYTLKVNTYCGDGVKQTPNMEGRGGIYNDGYEDCDGNSGVTTNIASSNISLQYGCQTGVGVITPYPILTTDQCIFKSPIDGGGYCGDGYCQALGANNQPLETCGSCPQDCGTCPIPPITISGTVTSYFYYGNPSQALAGVQINITDATGGAIGSATTDASGHYSLLISSQLVSSTKTYTATASLAGYDNAIQTFIPDTSKVINFMMSTPGYRGVNKIKLEWGVSPSDLDSHLIFGTTSHVWYPADCHDVNSANLDNDITNSYGPENIRIESYMANNYQYYVFNFSRCANHDSAGFGSAHVTVYNSNNGIIKTYNVNTDQPSQVRCYWHVFNMDNQGNITDVNTYSDSGPPKAIGDNSNCAGW